MSSTPLPPRSERTHDLIREHVADRHPVTRLGCPVCADLPRQRREQQPAWVKRMALNAKDLTEGASR
jgi:hypothetical protein